MSLLKASSSIKWASVEWFAQKGSPMDKMYGWVGDTKVFSNDWVNGPRGDFMSANSMKYISFGWRWFGGGADVSTIWFDDIEVGSERIGCN